MQLFKSLLCLSIVTTFSACSVTSREVPPSPDTFASRSFSSTPRVAVKALPSPKLEINPAVLQQINHFKKAGGRFIESALMRREQAYPIFSQIFKDEGMPHELLNLAVVESGYRTSARSHVGAVGLWQFMRTTGNIYGLEVSKKHDQRRDPVLVTIAAARFLRDLYESFGDWNLALAAYNCGPGAVSRVIARTGERDFWKLIKRGKFTKQTRDFVPRFIAVSLIARDPARYGFQFGQELIAKNRGENEIAKDTQIAEAQVALPSWNGARRTPVSFRKGTVSGRNKGTSS